MEIVRTLAGGVLLVVSFVWSFEDLKLPPSRAKALAKIVLGVGLTALFRDQNPYLLCLTVIVALLGVADLAAVRGKKEED